MNTTVPAMQPKVFERKYELDSLAAFLKLSNQYHNAMPHDLSPYDAHWRGAVELAVQAMRGMQTATEDDPGIYRFQRTTTAPTDTLWQGTGFPGAWTGMIRSAFRPSDDACTYPFLVPANAMAVVELRGVSKLLDTLSLQDDPSSSPSSSIPCPGCSDLGKEASSLANEVDQGIREYGRLTRPLRGIRSEGSPSPFAYEVDGYGNELFMDDANVPSLLSLPYLGYTAVDDEAYLATRRGVLSGAHNPYFFNGTAAAGIGSPHTGLGNIWYMGIIMRALTSTEEGEITACLEMLKKAGAPTGFMHESFNKDNIGVFTRQWFSWANSLFGELILTLAQHKPHLLNQNYTGGGGVSAL